MLRLMVQGDRDARGIEEAVRELGELCKERGIGLNVGEAGEIVRILAETGAHVRVHRAKPEPPNVPEGSTNVEIVDCHRVFRLTEDFAVPNLELKPSRVAWAIRLACLDASNGFIFFPGREGTLAHLVPIMAFIAKGERDKGVARPRRVALVGWEEKTLLALEYLFNESILVSPEDATYCCAIESTKLAETITWLTDGLPAK